MSNKIEKIVSCAIEGGYGDILALTSTHIGINEYQLTGLLLRMVIDPKFFQAIVKAKGLSTSCHHLGGDGLYQVMRHTPCISGYSKGQIIGIEFHRINLTQSFDDAINYLYELIK